MAEQTFTDEKDCVSFFDDLIQFPSVTDTSLNSLDCNDFADIWTNKADELQASDPIFSDSNGASTLSAVLAVPYEEIVHLEWLSNFMEDSFSGGGMTMNNEKIPVKKELEPEPLVAPNYQFQMSSPVSVLESSSSSSSSSSCSGGSNGSMMGPLTSTHGGPQRARTKRLRPPTYNPRAGVELFSPSTFIPVPGSMESENLAESHNMPKSGIHGPDQKKRKKPKKPEAEFIPEDKTENQNQNQNQNQTGHGVRKCMHCEITKTPQWRAGPMGPKTLCNACGVRYKSGRLFPEYRPAASPTFVPSLHSNSHKKVVEMRTKCMPNDIMASLPAPEPELIPNMNPPVDYM